MSRPMNEFDDAVMSTLETFDTQVVDEYNVDQLERLEEEDNEDAEDLARELFSDDGVDVFDDMGADDEDENFPGQSINVDIGEGSRTMDYEWGNYGQDRDVVLSEGLPLFYDYGCFENQPDWLADPDEYEGFDMSHSKGELYKGQRFVSKEAAIHAVRVYSIQNRVEYMVYKSEPCMVNLKCRLDGEDGIKCKWHFRAVKKKNSVMFVCSVYSGPHTCEVDIIPDDNVHLNKDFIGWEIKDIIQERVRISPLLVKNMMQKQYEFEVSYLKAWRGRQKALELLFGDWEKSFNMLPSYMDTLCKHNPGTVVYWQKSEVDGIQYVDRLFWSFGPAIEAFKHCRPLLSVDGTHLYGKYQGKLLVTGNEQCDDWSVVCLDLLGRDPERGRSRYCVHLSWFQQHMATPPDDADEQTLLQYARAYILCMLGSSLLTDTTGNEIMLFYLPLLRDIDAVSTYSWGSAVLAFLYRQLCIACVGKHKLIGGATLLLQFWCWERMSIGRPQQTGLPNHAWPEGAEDQPLMLPAISYGRWAGTRTYAQSPHQVLLYYRDQLDRQSATDLTWVPYDAERLQGINSLCLRDHNMWSAEVPMICFYIVEWHYQSRVMRQFGWEPVIPEPTRDGHSELHKIDRRKGKLDWTLEHQRWIQIWERRHDYIITGSDVFDPATHASYSTWYDRITRRLIQPTHFHMTMYQPTSHERTLLLKTVVQSCKAASKIFSADGQLVKKLAHDLFHSCRATLRDMNQEALVPIDPAGIRLTDEGGSSSVPETSVVHETDIGIEDATEDQVAVDITGPSQLTQVAEPPHLRNEAIPRHSTRTKRGRIRYTPSQEEQGRRRFDH